MMSKAPEISDCTHEKIKYSSPFSMQLYLAPKGGKKDTKAHIKSDFLLVGAILLNHIEIFWRKSSEYGT